MRCVRGWEIMAFLKTIFKFDAEVKLDKCLNPNCIGLKYSLIVWGNKIGHVSDLTSLLVKTFSFFKI